MINASIAQKITKEGQELQKQNVENLIHTQAKQGLNFVVLFCGITREFEDELKSLGYMIGECTGTFGEKLIKITW